jgi:predicted dehydrogenase
MNATQERKMMAAIIGCGFIGETLAKAIDKEMSDRMELVALYDQFKDRATQLSQALDARPKVVEDLGGFQSAFRDSAYVCGWGGGFCRGSWCLRSQVGLG